MSLSSVVKKLARQNIALQLQVERLKEPHAPYAHLTDVIHIDKSMPDWSWLSEVQRIDMRERALKSLLRSLIHRRLLHVCKAFVRWRERIFVKGSPPAPSIPPSSHAQPIRRVSSAQIFEVGPRSKHNSTMMESRVDRIVHQTTQTTSVNSKQETQGVCSATNLKTVMSTAQASSPRRRRSSAKRIQVTVVNTPSPESPESWWAKHRPPSIQALATMPSQVRENIRRGLDERVGLAVQTECSSTKDAPCGPGGFPSS
ncbi:hypothetical protein AeRB84_020573 [Aphanomyces euteiches]|nr:hypothetical protein AeRB84_020573 [Aphanomyces euteiches]